VSEQEVTPHQRRFYEAVRFAAEMLRTPGGYYRDPDPANPVECMAQALMSASGAGPFEDRDRRRKEWGEEREQRFCAVRSVLDSAGISHNVGKLEDQVAELKRQRDVAEREHCELAKQVIQEGLARNMATTIGTIPMPTFPDVPLGDVVAAKVIRVPTFNDTVRLAFGVTVSARGIAEHVQSDADFGLRFTSVMSKHFVRALIAALQEKPKP
jgi:hypothetical protein